MGLGKWTENEIYTVFSIPLEWETNKLIVAHLRYLADEIDKENISIQSIRLNTPINQPYAKPRLEIITITRESEG